MSCEYIDDLRKTINRLFISGQLDETIPTEISLSLVEFLAHDSNTHCTKIKYEIADTIKEINGIKIDHGSGVSIIYVASGLNYCWSRFTVAKELCNIIMDNNFHDYATEMPSNLLSQLSSLKPNSSNDDSGLAPDLFAEIGACELLLPKQYAKNASGLAQIHGNRYVASLYGIPEKWIEMRFGALEKLF